MRPILYKVFTILQLVVTNLVVIAILLPQISKSVVPPGDKVEQVRASTRMIEFDFTNWTLDALHVKGSQAAAGLPGYMSDIAQRQVVLDYLRLVQRIERTRGEIERIYADPNISDPATATWSLSAELERLQGVRQELGPLAESVLQQQTASVLAEAGLTTGGQPLPPVLYRVSALPLALIVSPRNVIQQDANIMLISDLSLEQITDLEKEVARRLNVSTMVTQVGGVGAYPTMVMSTSSMSYLAEVIAHEWTHNYLTMRPLGMSYDKTPELRTMNETTASLAGVEIGNMVLERYYPEFLPPPPPPPSSEKGGTETTPTPPAFDFNKEMHTTRVEADALLAAGKIEEAEAYMEARRQVFWENGYQIRVLNQAYFAFYGAYADTPGGAAGEDPVGPAVTALRAQSASLADFINRIAWMSSFEELERAVEHGE